MLILSLDSLVRHCDDDSNSYDEESLSGILSTFRCSRNDDVEKFLKCTSVKYERESQSRTYLIIDEKRPPEADNFIMGYFTLALKTLYISKLPCSQRKKLNGRHSSSGDPIPSFLIGQIGRNDCTKKEDLSGKKIMDFALSHIEQAYSYVGGRVIILECMNNPSLKKFYERCGFNYLQEHTNHENLIQMISFISDNTNISQH